MHWTERTKAFAMLSWLTIGLAGCGASSTAVIYGIWNNSPFWQVALSGAFIGISAAVLMVWGVVFVAAAEAYAKKQKAKPEL